MYRGEQSGIVERWIGGWGEDHNDNPQGGWMEGRVWHRCEVPIMGFASKWISILIGFQFEEERNKPETEMEVEVGRGGGPGMEWKVEWNVGSTETMNVS